jgi:predicted ester cyclase
MPLALAHYKDVPDFIYGITREIWEDRGIGGKIKRYYADDCLVRAATGVTTDNTGVTAQTLQTLHQFPDRQLVGEDVIWTGYEDGSFLSSHRLISVMRHTGAGIYGPATGRVVRSRIIADCWVVDTQVKEEWLARDQSAFARCMGIDPRQMAWDMVQLDLKRSGEVGFFTPERDVPGRYRPEHQKGADIERYCEGWQRIWGLKETAEIQDLYFHGAAVAVPGGDMLYGWGDIDRFALSYLASFPDAVFTMESAIVNRDPGQAIRIATRWSLRGTHAGFGLFGRPTGADVYVMGYSHAQMVNGRVIAEWIVVDEVSVWKQIIAHEESRAGA